MSASLLYEVPVTTAATVTTLAVVSAASPEEAGEKALSHVRQHGAWCDLDEDSIHWDEAYLPDPEGAEVITMPTEERSADERPRGVMVVVADEHGADQAVYLNGHIIQSTDAAQGGSIEDIVWIAQNLADALGVVVQTVNLPQQGSNWSWGDVTCALGYRAPATEQDLCAEFERFCTTESLPKQSADELLLLSLTETQRAWLVRFVARWEAVVGF